MHTDTASSAAAVSAGSSSNFLISIKGLQKDFGATKVLKGVDFSVRSGEIHALLGGNGAGKSTLIRIVTGDIRPNGGQIDLSSRTGKPPVIAVVHQELALLPELSVAENIGLVHAKSWRSLHSARDAAVIARDALAIIDPHLAQTGLARKASTLTLHESQIVEIARALSTGAEVLLLDEPTANLTAGETDRLFAVLKKLAHDEGIGIVFVSHRMKEIRQLCDVCTIIRDGRTEVDARSLETLTDAEIIEYMGQPAHRAQTSRRRETGSPPDVSLVGPNMALPIARGQILGLAGSPVGPSAVISALVGTGADDSWTLRGEGWPIRPSTPKIAVQNGIGYVTGDRGHKGVLSQLPIVDNVLASRRVMQKRTYVGRSERAECGSLIEALNVKIGSVWDHPSTLSGGNQQKLLIARWLGLDLRLVVFEEPTRGVDIGTKRDIYKLIREMADTGTIVIWWSTENVELIELCDDILAFDTEGEAKGLLDPETFNEDALSRLTGMAA